MHQDYLYTIFDDQWNPSDALENALSMVESDDAKLFQRLHTPGYTSTESDRGHLCRVLALQATRHPDILRRTVRRCRDLAKVLADVHDLSLDEFKAQMNEFAVCEADARDFYIQLRSRTKGLLAAELAELNELSPQSPQLPEQDALRAMPLVVSHLRQMELWLLDSPASEAFVLGDTPIPQSQLQSGFSVPLSRSLAVRALPTQSTQTLLSRRNATPAEVRDINRTQSDNSVSIVIGPSRALLAAL